VISPFDKYVPRILGAHYDAVPEVQARVGDILVWRGGSADEVVHSAILTDIILIPGHDCLDHATRLQTKNGIALETNMTLGKLSEDFYGESYQAYRKRQG
jgi:hypothetical protein